MRLTEGNGEEMVTVQTKTASSETVSADAPSKRTGALPVRLASLVISVGVGAVLAFGPAGVANAGGGNWTGSNRPGIVLPAGGGQWGG